MVRQSGLAPKRIAIVQGNYIPWKGYFDLIAAVDELILLDDVQYTDGDWRNRNRIKTAQGLHWLTIPVPRRGRLKRRICDTEISDPGWAAKHWKTLQSAYSRATYFRSYAAALEELYLDCTERRLAAINYRFLTAICRELRIGTHMTRSTDYRPEGERTARLVSLCEQAGATEYVSGPAARAYLDTNQFAAAGIRVVWFDYSGYPEYRQLYPPFEHAVSIVDLLLNEGRSARSFMKCGELETTETRR